MKGIQIAALFLLATLTGAFLALRSPVIAKLRADVRAANADEQMVSLKRRSVSAEERLASAQERILSLSESAKGAEALRDAVADKPHDEARVWLPLPGYNKR